MRSSTQCRLTFEREILAQELPQFCFYDINGNAYISGWQSTAARYTNYQLKLVMGYDFPDMMPELFITSPGILYQYDGYSTVNGEGLSHEFHTLDNGPGGCVQICHTKPELWSPSQTCVFVLMKGIVWLEAYDAHLRTGRLCDYCDAD